jgi:hypothetical protein
MVDVVAVFDPNMCVCAYARLEYRRGHYAFIFPVPPFAALGSSYSYSVDGAAGAGLGCTNLRNSSLSCVDSVTEC